MNSFFCDLCGNEFHRRDDLENHLLIHSYKSLYSCTICPYKSSYKEALADHMSCHTNVKFFCRFCSYETENNDNFQVHMKIHEVIHKNQMETQNNIYSLHDAHIESTESKCGFVVFD